MWSFPCTCLEVTLGSGGIAPLILHIHTTAHSSYPYKMDVRGQNHTQPVLPLGKISQHPVNRRLSGLKEMVWTFWKRVLFNSAEIQILDHLAHSWVIVLPKLSHLPKVCYCQWKFNYSCTYNLFIYLQNIFLSTMEWWNISQIYEYS